MKESREKATRIWVLALTSVASFMISLDVQVVSTALPTIRLHLGASIEDLEWTVNAYILTFAVLLLTGAALGDRFGRRRMFVTGLLLFVLASAACALAPTIRALIAARAVQGCGASLMLPLALTLLSEAFEPAQRGRALGIFGSVTGLALIAGPVLGGPSLGVWPGSGSSGSTSPLACLSLSWRCARSRRASGHALRSTSVACC